ncbi:hypothetical protein NKI94_26125 [Mesorhizobium australicum]|uniref:hypothetical protein n=1 Tax=Mesorhizobium australicum TaxID=536018 RepID=UPI00333827CF
MVGTGSEGGAKVHCKTAFLANWHFGGWLVRAGMNRGNARLNSYALDQLQLVQEDRVVEIGFGGATAISTLLGARIIRLRC